MFLRIFFIVWTGLHVYVFWRLSTLPFITRHVGRWPIIAIAVILWTSFLLPRFIEGTWAEKFMGPIELFGSDWLGIIFLLFSCFLAADIVTLFGLVLRPIVPTLRMGALGVGLLLSVIALVQGMRAPAVNEYEVNIRNLPAEDNGLTVAVISDLHVGTLLDENWLAARVAQVNELHPDLIFIVGDIFEGHGRDEKWNAMLSTMGRLSAPLGVWAVTGNHEHYSGTATDIDIYRQAGIHMLRDEWEQVRPGLVIAGVNDPGGHVISDTVGSLRQALVGRPAGVATLFLSHRPQGAEQAADAGVGLMLSGHTHGGQIWPFTYLSGLVNPLLAGRYNVHGMPVIVCRGTGTWGPRMRLWSRSEILRITLRTE